jgi:hypothetical protein
LGLVSNVDLALFLLALFFGQKEEVEVDPPRGIRRLSKKFSLKGSNKKRMFFYSPPPPLQLPVSPFSTTALTIFVNNNFSIFAYPSYYAHIWFVSVRPQKTFKIQGGGEQKL